MTSAPSMSTLVLGDLSGLQDFLFDVASFGGGQARRLRSRSLFISLLAECSALRLLETLGWSRHEIVFSAAGKFLLAGPFLDEAATAAARETVREISQWLFTTTGAALRLTAAVASQTPGRSLAQVYETAQAELQRGKSQPWANLLLSSGRWQSTHLILPPLSPPCDLCRRRSAPHSETTDEGQTLLLCDPCFRDGRLGRQLPQANWLELRDQPSANDFDLAGYGLRASRERQPSPASRYAFALAEQPEANHPGVVPRRVARHVPRQSNGQPIEFKDIAAQSEGMPLLGVLKMDADNLGEAFQRAMRAAPDFSALQRLSERLDDFFARKVDQMARTPAWNMLYIIFSGGDDLLLAGPWHVALVFAGEAQRAFNQEFAQDGLTLSAALSVIKPAFPIRSAAEQADTLLHQAKTRPAESFKTAKDQCAAFGQVWKWSDHARVLGSAGQLAEWVRQKIMPRGWLHTLLEIAESSRRHPAAPCAARLAYHIGRNYPPRHSPGAKGELRAWADALLQDFEMRARPETRLLEAILRHALTATRSQPNDEP